jgi:hypothetical protein
MTDFEVFTVLYWLFKKFEDPAVTAFTLDNDFQFTLVNADVEHSDLFHYAVTYENLTIQVDIFGIDTTRQYGPLSNIHLVYFTWDNYLRFSYKKYAMALSPRGSEPPQLMLLKHYRVDSDAWKDTENCDTYVEQHMVMLLPFHMCDLTNDCTCKICTRQPPSLADSA